MPALEITERFFTAFYSGDIAGTRDAVTPDVTLLGPFATVHNADELIELSKGLMGIARGHTMLHVVASEDELVALYEIVIQGPKGPGSLVVGGWFETRGELVSRGRVIYDSAAFDAILAPS
jgi:hypothetical protein